jgi:hypothetical protein
MKKLQKKKMQLSDSGEHVWPDQAKIAGFRPDSSRSVAGSIQIQPNSDNFGQIWPDQ